MSGAIVSEEASCQVLRQFLECIQRSGYVFEKSATYFKEIPVVDQDSVQSIWPETATDILIYLDYLVNFLSMVPVADPFTIEQRRENRTLLIAEFGVDLVDKYLEQTNPLKPVIHTNVSGRLEFVCLLVAETIKNSTNRPTDILWLSRLQKISQDFIDIAKSYHEIPDNPPYNIQEKLQKLMQMQELVAQFLSHFTHEQLFELRQSPTESLFSVPEAVLV